MIQILYPLVFLEMGLILALVFGTPVRRLLIMGLDRAKQGRSPLVAKTVAGTLFVVFISSLYSVMEIQKRSMETGSLNPTDQVLQAYNLLEASLMGFSLFLGLIIDRLHYYIKELKLLKNSMEEITQEHKTGVMQERSLKAEQGTKLKETDSKPTKQL
ncbi:uncharacterized protein LOC131329375 [Rhododendron vialii]|uniref:uncharacterized protein LOC131329375 n=1 Tax=Rhododendron vialii TaxID=182163 RepID=UPI00265ED2FE|nr:uncharacterized protein LOC131329375 [Rhododendron vialii]